MKSLQDKAKGSAREPVPGQELRSIYAGIPYLSIKHSSYFSVYETIFSRFRGRDITFIEVGVLNGGSLFMWREYFGSMARIIGIDLNPAAKRWEAHGFEIFVGSQSDPNFWAGLFAKIGPVDILLDDGGHTNRQQAITLRQCVNHIRDGGIVVIEDVHCSYMTEFGNPSRTSFISLTKRIIDQLNARSPLTRMPKTIFSEAIFSIRYFESIVVFEVDRRLCGVVTPTTNGGAGAGASDFRYEGTIASTIRRWTAHLEVFRATPLLWRIQLFGPALLGIVARIESRKLRDDLN